VCVLQRERETVCARESVCVCVLLREGERERDYVCKRERMLEKERERVRARTHIYVCMYTHTHSYTRAHVHSACVCSRIPLDTYTKYCLRSLPTLKTYLTSPSLSCPFQDHVNSLPVGLGFLKPACCRMSMFLALVSSWPSPFLLLPSTFLDFTFCPSADSSLIF